MDREELVERTKKWSLEFQCACNTHDPSSDLPHQPLCPPLRNPELVAVEKQLEPNPGDCVPSCCLVPRQGHVEGGAQQEENDQSSSAARPAGFQQKVVGHEHVPGE